MNETSDLTSLFAGRSIVAVDMVEGVGVTSTLTLSDGTVLEVIPNEGGCICGAGDYWISRMATTDNVITNVEVIDTETDEYGEGHIFKIFVYTAHEALAAIEIEGDDGNGYYGTGFWIGVRGESRW